VRPLRSSAEDLPVEECEAYVIKPVLTEEEMLAWAKELDEVVQSNGRGRNIFESFRRGDFNDDPRPRTATDLDMDQKETMQKLTDLLARRGQPGAPKFSSEELSEVREALRGVDTILEKDEKGGPGDEMKLNGEGSDRAKATSEVLKGAPDPIYGTVEVRERIYMFVWALLQARQSEGSSAPEASDA